MTNLSLEIFGGSYLAVVGLLSEADEAQWQAGKSPVPREDTTERSQGMTSDPTPTITADERRLGLRVAVIAAERELNEANRRLSAAAHHLSEALNKWQG